MLSLHSRDREKERAKVWWWTVERAFNGYSLQLRCADSRWAGWGCFNQPTTTHTHTHTHSTDYPEALKSGSSVVPDWWLVDESHVGWMCATGSEACAITLITIITGIDLFVFQKKKSHYVWHKTQFDEINVKTTDRLMGWCYTNLAVICSVCVYILYILYTRQHGVHRRTCHMHPSTQFHSAEILLTPHR